MTIISYIIGQKHYKVDYPLRRIGGYALLAAVLWVAEELVDFGYLWLNLIYRTLLLVVFAVYLLKKDLPLSEIPVLKRLIKKN
jgi:hypothetical protein